MDEADLEQEAIIVWLRCATRYKTDNIRHLGALYKMAFSRHMIDLGRRNKRTRLHEFLPETDVDIAMLDARVDLGGEGLLLAALRKAPEEVTKFIDALFRDDCLLTLRSRHRMYDDGTRMTTDEKWCRAAGIASVPIRKMLMEFLTDGGGETKGAKA